MIFLFLAYSIKVKRWLAKKYARFLQFKQNLHIEFNKNRIYR